MSILQTRMQLIRALRGRRSTLHLSQRLGYRSNQVARWESGRQQVPWASFVELCERCGTDVGSALRSAFGFEGVGRDFATVARHAVGTVPIASVTRFSGVSRFTLSRWLSGSATPTLDQALFFLQRLRFPLAKLSAALVTAQAASEPPLDDLAKAAPWYPVALALLRSNPVKRERVHEALAPLGLSPRHVDDLLERLLQAKLVAVRNDGVLEDQSRPAMYGEYRTESYHRVAAYWQGATASLLGRSTKRSENTRIGWEAFAVSDAALAAMREEYNRYIRAVRHIVANDTARPQALKVLTTTLIDVAELVAHRPLGSPQQHEK